MALLNEDDEFTWGTPDATIHIKERTFYTSFFYHGEEYFLFDNVVVYDQHELLGHVAKIMKLWEDSSTGQKKTLLRWFLRPEELPSHLRPQSTSASRHQKELFLAFGQGKGVCNENNLDCIMRKCKVLCTSKDIRNKQPSEGDLRDAEYLFSEVYNVDCKKLLKVERIAKMLGKEAIFNKPEWLSDRDPVFEQNMLLPKDKQKSASTDSTIEEILPVLGTRLQVLNINIEENLKLGKVLLLQNFDPSFTSADLHDLISDAFEGCLFGEILCPYPSTDGCSVVDALLVFETSDLANSALQTLEEDYLVLSGSNRVLIGRKVASCEQSRISRFLGHFPLDIFESKRHYEAHMMSQTLENVDVCRFSELNTVEYEMAMDWKLFRSAICSCWNQLSKVQEEELNALQRRHKWPCVRSSD